MKEFKKHFWDAAFSSAAVLCVSLRLATPRLAAMDSTPLLTHWRFKNTLFIKVKHTKLKLTHTLKIVFFQ